MTVIHNLTSNVFFAKRILISEFWLWITNLKNHIYRFFVYKKKIYFLRVAQYYMVLGGSFSSSIGCFATIESPCINI